MLNINFTKKTINSFICPDKKKLYSDLQVRELKIRHSPSDSKVFSFKKKFQGKTIEIAIGPYPEISIEQARLKALDFKTKLANGIDPRKPKVLADYLDDLWKMYLEQHLKINSTDKSIADAIGNYRLYIKPVFGKENINKISPSQTRKFFSNLFSKKGYAPHNKVLNLFKAMMNKAIEWELIEKSPITVKKAKDVKRERYLLPEEVPSFFKALDEEPREWFRDYVLLSLLTGARQNNILSMRWEDISFVQENWHIPKTKNGDTLNVPLVSEAIEILKARQNLDKFVFYSPTSKFGYHIGVDRPWKELLERANIKNLRLHDLRRSLGSWQANLGTSLNIIGKSLGHRSVSTTAIYARLQTDPVKKSMENAIAEIYKASKSNN